MHPQGRAAPGPTSMPCVQVPAHRQLALGWLEGWDPPFFCAALGVAGRGARGPQVMPHPPAPRRAMAPGPLVWPNPSSPLSLSLSPLFASFLAPVRTYLLLVACFCLLAAQRRDLSCAHHAPRHCSSARDTVDTQQQSTRSVTRRVSPRLSLSCSRDPHGLKAPGDGLLSPDKAVTQGRSLWLAHPGHGARKRGQKENCQEPEGGPGEGRSEAHHPEPAGARGGRGCRRRR